MDKIMARRLRFYGCHGVLEEEKKRRQPFEVDLDLYLDLQHAGFSDDLQQTVNYDQAFHLVRVIVEQEHFNLIEALAERIAAAVLAEFPVQEVEVTLYKPEAPVAGEFKYFAVKIHRLRQ